MLKLKQRVYEANMKLANSGLVILTWGNVSEIDRTKGIVAIKPSGVEYNNLSIDDIVVVDLDGNILDGKLRPSSDIKTHLEIYKKFINVGGICHTHSTYAVAFAQAKNNITAYGTTHADTFYGDVICTRDLTIDEINSDYELNTAKVIIEAFEGVDYMAAPAVLAASHGPFTWGSDSNKAVENAIILEEVAKIAYLTKDINPSVKRINQKLLDKHYYRKHGKNSYYGQGE